MKIFDKLFRRQRCSIDIVTIEEPSADTQDTAVKNSKTEYYVNILVNGENLEPIIEEKQFRKAVKEMPADKVAVFFNLEAIKVISEKNFKALDEYINLAKDKNPEKAFYRGVRHGPCVVYAFAKDCIPDGFNGSCFIGMPTVVRYL